VQEGIGVIPYSPLAGGKLTRDPGQTTRRDETDKVLHLKYDASAENDRPIVDRVAAIAAQRGVTRAQVALAWVLQKQPVTAPIIGATKPLHLEDAVAALSLKLSPDEIASLEEPYVPHKVVGAL
jgi:aryl-alcohol dehydrogenase-like predicted oxidoreductase